VGVLQSYVWLLMLIHTHQGYLTLSSDLSLLIFRVLYQPLNSYLWEIELFYVFGWPRLMLGGQEWP
jgi:hypothetical protein